MSKDYFTNEIIFKFIIWFSISLVGYILANLYLLIKFKLPCCFQNCFISDDDRYFHIEYNDKTNEQKARDLTSFVLYTSVFFYFSNILNRLDYYNPYQIFYIFIYFLSILIFGIFGTLKGMQTSCSTNSIRRWSIIAKIIYSLIGITVLIIIGYHLYLSYEDKSIFYYIISIVCIVIYYIFIYYYYIIQPSSPTPRSGTAEEHTIHIHHWFLGYMACLYFRFDDITSNIVFSIAYGIFTQGLVNYGITDIFN